jgi:hypothetical protein
MAIRDRIKAAWVNGGPHASHRSMIGAKW